MAEIVAGTSDWPRSFGRRLRKERRARDITQHALAVLAGTQAPTISRLEAGRMLPGALILRRLCTALGVRADYLLDLVNEVEPE